MSEWRYFGSYTGIKLPLKLVGPLDESELGHRNTFMRARYDADGRILGCEKVVYGEVQLSHTYTWAADKLARAEITMDDETTVLEFD